MATKKNPLPPGGQVPFSFFQFPIPTRPPEISELAWGPCARVILWIQHLAHNSQYCDNGEVDWPQFCQDARIQHAWLMAILDSRSRLSQYTDPVNLCRIGDTFGVSISDFYR